MAKQYIGIFEYLNIDNGNGIVLAYIGVCMYIGFGVLVCRGTIGIGSIGYCMWVQSNTMHMPQQQQLSSLSQDLIGYGTK